MLKVDYSLNQILYGPPGTGKTYHTINLALAICGQPTNGLTRQQTKKRFEEMLNQGRIVFTTFHQSMTYEDFIEGIKPMEPAQEGYPVTYKVQDGLLRQLCTEAAFSVAQQNEPESMKKAVSFSLAFDTMAQEAAEKAAIDKPVKVFTKNKGKILLDGISQQGNIIVRHYGKETTYTISKARLSKLHEAFPDLDDINNIDSQFRQVIGGSNATANWAVLNAIREDYLTDNGSKQTHFSYEDKREITQQLESEDYAGKTGQPYVLIIDEINRGNVSQIFGELITLIEKDKRLGRAEALRVQLPYSKEWFGVPPNVYIIGTMNTADRSVEALDTALRRRFSFTEMPPKPSLISEAGKAPNGLIDDIDLVEWLTLINKRIEKLLDKDHMIGHSYLLAVDDLSGFKNVFQNKIIPLLQEYFFGDDGRIGQVIGQGFFEADDDSNDSDFFAPFYNYDSSMPAERKVYHLKKIDKMSDDDFRAALNLMTGKPTDGTDIADTTTR